MDSIIITGAGGNLGRAVTDELASEYTIYAALGIGEDNTFFNDHAKKENLHTESINLTNETESAAFVKKVLNQSKDLHAAVLLVGGWQKGNLVDTHFSDLDKMVNLNFTTAFNIVRPLYEYFRSIGQGRFIFIGARPAIDSHQAKDQFAYAISKGMLIKMAEIINQTSETHNIQAHIIIPSVLDTPQNRIAMPDAQPADWVKPKHIALSIKFLLSEVGQNYRETILKIYNNA